MQRAREWLENASRVAALTGAGISAESGVPTFRGPGGLWEQYRPEDLATPEAFARDPLLVWRWYDWRRIRIAGASPNAGHMALAELERKKVEFTLITQNVDGLHERAGSRRLVKLHGDIWEVFCTSCGRRERNEQAPLAELPPRCPECRGLLRPGVVWFGEPLPAGAWQQAEQAACSAEVFLVIGTSAAVYPAAGLAWAAKAAGARIIEVNPEETGISPLADETLRGPAGELLPRLIS